MNSQPSGTKGDASDPAGLRAWTFLFASLTLAAGHAVFLTLSLIDVWPELSGSEGAGPLARLMEAAGGQRPRIGAAAMLALMATPPLALLALVLRRALMRSRLIVPLAALSVLGTAASFAIYLSNTVRG